ncbi:MAG: Ig domain-containing protein, partial [Myxococcaceae bacterium]
QVGSSGVQVATTALVDAIVASPYSKELYAVGFYSPVKWTAAEPLPEGLLLTEEGVLSGTPTTAGNATVAVKVSNGVQEASARYVLRVLPLLAELRVTSSRLPPAVKGPGMRYETTLGAAGGFAPYRWRLRGGSLPAGLTLADNGVLSGAVESQVAYNSDPLTVEVRDSAGNGAVEVIPVRVVEPTALLISEAIMPNGVVGATYQVDLASHVATSTAPATDVTWSLAEGDLPDGLTLSTLSGRGIISGIPNRAGVFTLVVQVTDSRGRSDNAQFTVTVFGVRAKVKSANLPSSVYPAGAAEFAFTFDTQKEARFSLYSGQLPPGLTLAENGTVTGAVAEDAPLRRYDFIIAAHDTDGTDGYGPFAIDVEPAPKKKQGCAAVPGELLGAAAWALIGLLHRRRR